MVIVIKKSSKRLFDEKGQEMNGICLYDPESPQQIEITLAPGVLKDPVTFYEVLGHELDHAVLYLAAERFKIKKLTNLRKHHQIAGILDHIRLGAMDDLLK